VTRRFCRRDMGRGAPHSKSFLLSDRVACIMDGGARMSVYDDFGAADLRRSRWQSVAADARATT